MSPEFRVRLPKPHPQQERFLRSQAKRKVVCAGRRSGKTTGAANLAVESFLAGKRVLYAAPTADQPGTFWKVICKALADPIIAGVFIKNEAEHTIEFPNTNQRIRARTAWNPDTLRGDYADVLILDEWQLMDENTWGEVGAPMLVDNNGVAIFFYTPPSRHSRSASKAGDPLHANKLFAKAQADKGGRWEPFHFTSHDNPYVSSGALADITKDMTREAYLREIEAENIDEIPGAIWTPSVIEASRVTEPPQLVRIVIAIDPSVTSGESSDKAGIVVGGIGEDGHGYLLDLSGRDSPLGWAKAAIEAYYRWQADRIVAEDNNGGEMVEWTLRTIDPDIPFEAVHARRGKVTRAEPICALYEQRRIHHVGCFEELEDEMCSYIPGAPSPNRMDAIRSYPDGEIYFRAAACTGALYEIELYIVCGELPDLEAGVYHFDPSDFALRKLRDGDLRCVLAHSTADDPAVSHAPVTIVCTGTYWRNAWKYRARTYRHFFWDNGTLLANLFATGAALGLPPRLDMGFVDDCVNRLLGLDTGREVAISLVALGRESGAIPASSAQLQPLKHRIAPYSHTEVDYPLMRQTHEASCLTDSKEVEEWRGRPPSFVESAPGGGVVDLKLLPEAELPRDSIEQVILRQGSTRQFAQLPIRFEQLSTVLVHATRDIPADYLKLLGTRLNDLYLIVNAVEGLSSGAYYLHRDRPCLELLKEGPFRQQAGNLALDQSLPADASVAIFFLADLKAILRRFGNRGYRAVQIEAGFIGGKIYLGAYALRLGATGLTFYDNEVTDFFSPHAAGKSAILQVV